MQGFRPYLMLTLRGYQHLEDTRKVLVYSTRYKLPDNLDERFPESFECLEFVIPIKFLQN